MDHGRQKIGDQQQICRVVTAYQSPYTEPFALHPGEELTIGHKESEWPGWVWCTNQHGESRWVPETYIERRGDTCVALCEYEATELSVQAGQELTVGHGESGWRWCTNQAGQSGWVPAEYLDFDRSEA